MNRITKSRAWKQEVKTDKAKRNFKQWYKDKVEQAKRINASN